MAMRPTLYLCANKSLNRDNATHYFFNDVAYFISNVLASSIVYNFVENDYRINEGVVIISEEATATLNNETCKEVTYIYEYAAGGFFRGFFVNRIEYQSGKVYFYVSVDNWGTYIAHADFGRLHLTRSNIYGSAAGFYDEALTSGFLNALEDSRISGSFTPAQLSIVFLLNYNVSQGVFSGDKIGRTELFAVTLQQCIDACTLQGLDKTTLTAIEMALDIIGGVSGVNSTTGTNEAEVIRAWIVPTSWLEYGDVVLSRITGKSLFSSEADGIRLDNVRQVVPSFKTGGYNLGQFARFVSEYPNHVVLFGPKYNGFKVPRLLPVYGTHELYVHYRVTIGQDDIQVVLFNGEDEHDISQNFAVRLTTANNVANPLQAMARDLSFGLNFTQGLFSGYKSGGGIGAAVNGAKSLLSNVANAGITKVNGSGDGFATWNEGAERSAAHNVKRPYFYMFYETLADEAARAVINGAKYDIFMDGLSQLETVAANMRFVASSNKETRAFVQMDEVYISGVPNEAMEYIKNELARGVYYAFVTIH